MGLTHSLLNVNNSFCWHCNIYTTTKDIMHTTSNNLVWGKCVKCNNLCKVFDKVNCRQIM